MYINPDKCQWLVGFRPFSFEFQELNIAIICSFHYEQIFFPAFIFSIPTHVLCSHASAARVLRQGLFTEARFGALCEFPKAGVVEYIILVFKMLRNHANLSLENVFTLSR